MESCYLRTILLPKSCNGCFCRMEVLRLVGKKMLHKRADSQAMCVLSKWDPSQLLFISDVCCHVTLFLEHFQLVLHRVWKNRASSGLEHARTWKFELKHARALENYTWSSFCPGIWLKMHYFCQNVPIFKGSFASSIKNWALSMLEHQKLTSYRHFSGLSMLGCNTSI